MADNFFSSGSLVFFALGLPSAFRPSSPALASSASFFVANGPCSAPPSLGTSQNRPLASFFTWTVDACAFALLVALGALDFVVVFLAMFKLLICVDGKAAIFR